MGIIRFFLDYSRINHLLLILIVCVGVWSYIKIPKEVFPEIIMDEIEVVGKYDGASIEVLDATVVQPLESSIGAIEGIEEVYAQVGAGRFYVFASFKGVSRLEMKEQVNQAVEGIKSALPSDATVSVNLDGAWNALMRIGIASGTYTKDELLKKAQSMASSFMALNDVGNAYVRESTQRTYKLAIDPQALGAYGIGMDAFLRALSRVASTASLGQIASGKSGQSDYALVTPNGRKSLDEFASTLLKVDGKVIYIKDVATITTQMDDAQVISSTDGDQSVQLNLNYKRGGDATAAAAQAHELMEILKTQDPKINFHVFSDFSVIIKNRLNVILSNVLMGVIILMVFLVFCINWRMSILVMMGVVTAFLLTITGLYLGGYSINIIVITGVLISLGVVVDDTIVVSENIQQKLEQGVAMADAVQEGAVDMLKPIMVASFTTVAAFLPMLLLEGEIGRFMRDAPVVLVAAIIGSVIEVFLFLPLHAKHLLHSEKGEEPWQKAKQYYTQVLSLCLTYRKSVFVGFVLVCVGLSAIGLETMRFKIFGRSDSRDIKIALKATEGTTLEQTFEITKAIQKELLPYKDQWGVEIIKSQAGEWRNLKGRKERASNVGLIELELYEVVPDDWINTYIMGLFEFYDIPDKPTRKLSSKTIENQIRQLLKDKNLKATYGLQELGIPQNRQRRSRPDVEIALEADGVDGDLLRQSLKELQNAIKAIEGVKSAFNNIPSGTPEIVIKPNAYGEALGLDEATLASYLSGYFLERTPVKFLVGNELVHVQTKAVGIEGIEDLKALPIAVGSTQFALGDVADLKMANTFKSIEKYQGKQYFEVFASVDSDVVTPTEVLEQIDPILKKLKAQGIQMVIEGEYIEQQKFLASILSASGVAIVLILVSLLYLFNGFRRALIVLSTIPLCMAGVFLGHWIAGVSLQAPSLIGVLGLAGVVVNDGIIMMLVISKAQNIQSFVHQASTRLRPIVLTSVTTFLGLVTLIFFPSPHVLSFQPLAVSLGFGLLWGTVLNLIYVPLVVLFTSKSLRQKDMATSF